MGVKKIVRIFEMFINVYGFFLKS